MLNKLISEINSLKQILSIRKRRGQIGDIETQFYKLKEENEKLKQFVKTNENIEKLIEENKLLKIELQKLKSEMKTDEFFDEKLSKNKSESSNTSSKKIHYQDDFSDNKLMNAGNNIMRNHNSINNLSNSNGIPDWITSKEMNEIKMKNKRLRYLEDLEKKNGMKIIKEMQRIENEKIKQNEEKLKKLNELKIHKKKIDGHLNKINYLYKNNSSVFSEYLAQSLNRNENKEKLKINNKYDGPFNTEDRYSTKLTDHNDRNINYPKKEALNSPGSNKISNTNGSVNSLRYNKSDINYLSNDT
jgi:hypothetical protein